MKKRFLSLLIMSLICLPVFASKKINLKPQPDKKTDDPTSAEHLLYESPQKVEKNASTNNNPNFKMKGSCTDQLGMVHNSGDSGYDACMRNLNRTQPEANSPKRSSVGITIK